MTVEWVIVASVASLAAPEGVTGIENFRCAGSNVQVRTASVRRPRSPGVIFGQAID
jgi:hypothetical protein